MEFCDKEWGDKTRRGYYRKKSGKSYEKIVVFPEFVQTPLQGEEFCICDCSYQLYYLHNIISNFL